jgi:hypothetical protein
MAYDDENRLIDWYNPVTATETVFIYVGLGRLRIRRESSSIRAGSQQLTFGA